MPKEAPMMKVELTKNYLVRGHNMPTGAIVEIESNQARYAVDMKDAKWCDPNAELTDMAPYAYQLKPRDELGRLLSDEGAAALGAAIGKAINDGKPKEVTK
jgi:hypothetical protein